MSRKYRIDRVEVTGATPFLGYDRCGAPMYSRDPERVMSWLGDAWRYRFNQLRSRRSRYLMGAKNVLVPISDNPDMRSIKETREDCSWLGSCPDLILLSCQYLENTEWFAATKRRKTNVKHGRKPGPMPSFRRKRSGLRFTVLRNNGKGYRIVTYSRKHAEVIIGGTNPAGHRIPGDGARFRVHIHFRLSRPVLDSTSIHVNWTARTISFTSPIPERDHTPTGRRTGIDVGVRHEAALSDGRLLDLPLAKLKQLDKRIDKLHHAQARCVREAGYSNAKPYLKHGPSKRYLELGRQARALQERKTRIITDWQHKTSRWLVDRHDLIVMETLQAANMTRKPKPKPDPDKPGQWLPNGRNAKRALNKGMQQASLSRLRGMIEYKSKAAGITFLTVNPAYTSQTCHHCGHVAKENRESQAVFHCHACGWRDNADVNAAKNILTDGLRILQAQAVAEARSGRDTSETRIQDTRPQAGQAEPMAVLQRRKTGRTGNTR